MLKNYTVRTIGHHSLFIHKDPMLRKRGSVHYSGPGGRTSAQIGAGKASKCCAILANRRVKQDNFWTTLGWRSGEKRRQRARSIHPRYDLHPRNQQPTQGATAWGTEEVAVLTIGIK